MPHTGLDPVTFAYLSLSLPSSRGVRSGLFSKPLYRVLLGFKKSVKENEKKNLKYLCKHIGRIASFTKGTRVVFLSGGGRWKRVRTHKRTSYFTCESPHAKERERREKKVFVVCIRAASPLYYHYIRTTV